MKTLLILLSMAALLVPLVGCVIQTPEYVIIYSPPRPLTNSEPARVDIQNLKSVSVSKHAEQLASY